MEMEYSADPVPRGNNWCFKLHEQWSVLCACRTASLAKHSLRKKGAQLNNRCVNSVGIFYGEEKKKVFTITENRGFIFRDGGVIIIRSASYLCIRAGVTDFNDSFSNLNLLSLSIPQSDDEVSQIKSRSGI